MGGILAYGSYVPRFLLQRSAIAAALRTSAGSGTRSVAGYDEDTTSMGIEAGRAALYNGDRVERLLFATASPAYLDKANATAIHAALGLDQRAFATDMVGSVRSGIGALRASLESPDPAFAVLSDIRTGLAGGADEQGGGDAAAALLCSAEGDHLATYLGGAAATAEFLDRWRVPGEIASHRWEERFGESVYVPLAKSAIAEALTAAGVEEKEIDHLVVTGLHSRSVRRVAAGVGVRDGAAVDDLTARIGNTGTAHPGLLLADVLDRAGPREIIALVVLADGADVLVFRTTEALPGRRQATSVADQIGSTRDDLPYARFQSWRGMLHLEPPRRPDPTPPAAPPAFRTRAWKFAFVGSRCACGTRHLPPVDVCLSCGAVGRMTPEPLSEAKATIVTYTVDHLAYSASPPCIVAVIDFDGGGRYQCELTDVDPDEVRIGARVEMTPRRMFTADSVHNYFWKARLVRGEC